MIKKVLTIASVLMFGLTIAACEKIEPMVLSGEPIDFVSTMDDIPLRYGRLVSTTSGGPFRTVLWFEQPDQTIVGVLVNWSRGTISEQVI